MTLILTLFLIAMYGLSCIGFYKELDAIFEEHPENSDLRYEPGYAWVLGFCAMIWPAILVPALIVKGVSKDDKQ